MELPGTASLRRTAPGEARVKMMTLHASKGLEFSHVFIIGVNYGLIPLRTKGADGEDEERRLFFVGITRARNYLELSWYTNPDIFGVMAGESRYIRMIPSELVQGQEPERRTEQPICRSCGDRYRWRRKMARRWQTGRREEKDEMEMGKGELGRRGNTPGIMSPESATLPKYGFAMKHTDTVKLLKKMTQ